MKECLFCKKETNNPSFCSSSCAAKHTNTGKPSHNRTHGNFIKKCCVTCSKFTTNIRFCSKKCSGYATQQKFIEKLINGLFTDPNSSPAVKAYLINIRTRKCEECGLETWLSKPIPINVHHIDGDSTNNLPINLKLLCLNCHGLTDNFGSKNKNCKRPPKKKNN